MSKDDVASITLAAAFVAWFFLPTFVRWLSGILRRREALELHRPGFPITKVGPSKSVKPSVDPAVK